MNVYTTDSTGLDEPSLVSTGLHRSPGVSTVLVPTCLNKSPLVSWSPLVSAGLGWSPDDHWRLKETSEDSLRPAETSEDQQRPAEISVGSLRNSLQSSEDHHRLGETKGDRETHGHTLGYCLLHAVIIISSITNDIHI